MAEADPQSCRGRYCTDARYLTLIAGMMSATLCGSIYAFALWSGALKEKFDYSQSELQTIGSWGNVGGYFAILAGFGYDRWGPRVAGYIGIFLFVTGYTLLYLSAKEVIPSSYLSMSAFYAIGSNSQPWFDTMGIITNMHNFPAAQGLAIGVTKAFNGLGGGVFTQLYIGFLKPHTLEYLIFLPICALLFILCFNVPHLIQRYPPPAPVYKNGERIIPSPLKRRLTFLYGIVIVLAIYILGTSLIERDIGVPRWLELLITALVILSYASFFLITLRSERLWHDESENDLLLDDRDNDYTIMDDDNKQIQQVSSSDEELKQALAVIPVSEDGLVDAQTEAEREQLIQAYDSILPTLKKYEFWLVFIALTAGCGSGLTLINNLAQIVHSLGGPSDEDKHDIQDVYVSLVSVSNCAGRMLAGFIANKYPRLPQSMHLAFACLLFVIANFYCAYANMAMFYAGCIVMGAAYGSLWAIMPAIVAELFGRHQIGAKYNFLNFAPMIGSQIFANIIASHYYDELADHQNNGNNKCYGEECYRTSFLIMGFVSVAGLISVAIVVARSKAIIQTRKSLGIFS